ncbi:hypothetical protein [Noviherbaspirillum pedocola]|uniref:PEP-CTERM protein-sorting domain-containing protein n=1 Tax=Noviherbaspirillum pedocola TaxID=2801341 RepID=A0A934W8V4_9BURK|nr:hypothetical protein [Noviherbaspirillum pedocola]MBK4739107.1 hypothetical protein [Noviherbaspirillum pedocola]
MKFVRTVLFALSMSLGAAHAALLSTDSPLGTGTGVFDTNTGWEWLQLSATRSLTIRQALDETSPVGVLSDFHYADRTELSTLTNAYLSFPCYRGCPEVALGVDYFFGHFGISFTTAHAVNTRLEPSPFTSNPGIYGALFVYYPEVLELYSDTQFLTLNEERLNDTGPHWIVREAGAIPEPPGTALFALGAIACAVICRRRGNGEDRAITFSAREVFLSIYLRHAQRRSK